MLGLRTGLSEELNRFWMAKCQNVVDDTHQSSRLSKWAETKYEIIYEVAIMRDTSPAHDFDRFWRRWRNFNLKLCVRRSSQNVEFLEKLSNFCER